MKATKANIKAVRKAIEARKERSAWSRGVKAYALEMLESFEDWRKWNEENGESVPELDERTALWCDADVKMKYHDIMSRYE